MMCISHWQTLMTAALSSYSRGVDPVLKVGGRGTNLYIHICMHIYAYIYIYICIYIYIYIIYIYIYIYIYMRPEIHVTVFL